MTLSNLLAWWVQVTIVAAAGAMLPFAFRLRESRGRLWYWHVMLLACIAIPLVEPWMHPAPARSDVTFTTGAFRAVGTPAATGFTISWPAVIAMILASGILLRLVCLGMGLFKLRRIRRSAVPLAPLHPALEELRRFVAPEAEVMMSRSVTSPVTFGIWNAVVLLPERVGSLSIQEQRSILCHELIHIQRRDWAVAIAEEFVRSILWFHPAIWWLLGQVQLTREQVVDEAVIEHTGDRDRYLEALLAIASLRLRADLAPAPLFLKKRHLRQRVESILSGAHMTKRNLLFPMAAALASLPVLIGVAAWQFPLRAAPQEAVDDNGVQVQINGPGVLHRTGVVFPEAARAKHISGTVIAKVTVDEQGEVTGATAVSGPEPLRKAVIGSVSNWHFAMDSPNAPRTFDIAVSFDGGKGNGEPSGLRADIGPAPADSVKPIESVNLSSLPAALRDKVMHAAILSSGEMLTREKADAASAALKELDEHLRMMALPGPNGGYAVVVRLAGPPPARVAEAEPRIRVGGNVQSANLISQTKPVYPPQAKQARIQGVVKFDTIIAKDGTIKNLQVISGHPMLVQAALEAVKTWLYKPTLLNGNPVEVQTVIDVNFTLSQ